MCNSIFYIEFTIYIYIHLLHMLLIYVIIILQFNSKCIIYSIYNVNTIHM